MKRLPVPAEVDADGAVGMDIGLLHQRGSQISAPDAADVAARFAGSHCRS
jgi:hypothetical protein